MRAAVLAFSCLIACGKPMVVAELKGVDPRFEKVIDLDRRLDAG